MMQETLWGGYQKKQVFNLRLTMGEATKRYNKAFEKLIKAELEILPLINWRITSFKVFLGPRFYYDYQWK